MEGQGGMSGVTEVEWEGRGRTYWVGKGRDARVGWDGREGAEWETSG